MKIYILRGHEPVAVGDVLEWGAWYEKADRQVAETMIGNVRVSTVFLGIDHNFGHVGPEMERIPILFETMVFGGPLDQEMSRYATWEEAEIGHAHMVELVLMEIGDPCPDAVIQKRTGSTG